MLVDTRTHTCLARLRSEGGGWRHCAHIATQLHARAHPSAPQSINWRAHTHNAFAVCVWGAGCGSRCWNKHTHTRICIHTHIRIPAWCGERYIESIHSSSLLSVGLRVAAMPTEETLISLTLCIKAELYHHNYPVCGSTKKSSKIFLRHKERRHDSQKLFAEMRGCFHLS